MNGLRTNPAYRPYFLYRPHLRRQPLWMIGRSATISLRWNYLYLRVAKAANSTTFLTLLESFPEEAISRLLASQPSAGIQQKKRVLETFTSLGPLQGWSTRRFFVFTVVRNPYHRALSAFLNKFGDQADLHAWETEEQRNFRTKYGAAVAAQDEGRISFRGFCRYLAKGGELENAHWVQQARIVALADRVDFVGRVETYEDDMKTILSTIAGEQRAVGQQRMGPVPSYADRKAGIYFDDESRSLVEAVYAEDFSRFGYRIGEL